MTENNENKDEPLKVMDLEAGDESAAPAKPAPQQPYREPLAPAKPKSVFDRLAYGGNQTRGAARRAAAAAAAEEQDKSEPTAGKTTGRLAAKPVGKGPQRGAKNQPAPAASSTDSGAPAQAPSTASSGGGSVFDRLASGERLYRGGNNQSTRRGGRRGDQVGDSSTGPGKKQGDGKKTNESVQPIDSTQAAAASGTVELSNGTASPEREELDAFDEEEDPIFSISMIQQPTKIRSAKPAKKSARLTSQHQRPRQRKSWRLRRIPLALVERSSLARGALPILPQFLAWICLIFNGLLPGTGTILSGLLGMCLGAPRFSAHVTAEHRILGLIINMTVGVFQAVTVLFCLVGWCWSLGWGIILVKTAGYYKTWKKNNANNPEEEHHLHMMNSIAGANIKDEPRY